mmetsp:Transcript_24307/g.58659  ORF Transcript_24307/g.58659 Transcript_24307/m.58659 type:complete len:349 (+) Transcript_24307:428-1474(+)
MGRSADQKQKYLWLDCDPGHDDAFAILLALHTPGVHLLGMSTVAGNQDVEKTTLNAQKILSLSNKLGEVTVLKGQSKPLLREKRHDPDIHGESGLEGSKALDAYSKAVVFPASEKLNADHKGENTLWICKMAERITEAPAPVTIVATGALTNVALFITLYPELLKTKVQQIVLMGGAIGIGNRSPVAEFNILCDPESAKIVFESDTKVVMVPLEVTHTALATGSVLQQIKDIDSPFAKMSVDLLCFFKDTYKDVFDFDDPPVHDPCAVAYVIAPEIFVTKFWHVEVICGEHTCAGQTVCDIWEDFATGKAKNVHVTTKMDVGAFWNMMLSALKECNKTTGFNEYVDKQ